jgi:hypothetical protein
MVFRGRDDLSVLPAAVYGGVKDLRWREEIGDGSVRVVIGEGARVSEASEPQRATNAGVDAGHEPVWQRADTVLEVAPVDRGDLRDVDH